MADAKLPSDGTESGTIEETRPDRTSMFRRRKPKEGGYKNEKIGNLVVEFVQLPHSIHGTDYKILNFTYRLCVEDGPCLFERTYTCGSDESMLALAGTIRMGAFVEGEWHARNLFYTALYEAWRKR